MARMPRSLGHIARSRRWTDEEAQIVIDALVASRLSVRAFAAEHGVQAQRIYLWRRKLGERDSVARRSLEFVEVDARPRTWPGRRYEIVMPNGVRLSIEGGVEASEVRTLVEILRESSSC